MPICNITETTYSALKSMYDSLNGSNWLYVHHSNMWHFPAPLWEPCSQPWEGIRCNMTTCDIRLITLPHLHLSGELSMNSIANLSGLEALRLNSNSLRGTLPDSWTALKHLEIIDLSDNELTGVIPTSWQAMTNLKSIALSLNKLTSTLPEQWSDLTELRRLFLYSNHIDGSLPTSWSVLSRLTQIDVSNNKLTGSLPSQWSTMTEMLSFTMFSNHLHGTIPRQWHIWKRLNELYLSMNSLSGRLPVSYSELFELRRLAMYSNHLSGDLPIVYSALTNLVEIFVSDNHFTGVLPTSWSTMEKLHTISGYFNQLTGPAPIEWSKMTSLATFNMYVNHFSGVMPSQWSTMKLVSIFSFRSNSMTGSLPSSWSTMTKMNRFKINNNSFSGQIPFEWNCMKNMTVLYIGSNHLTGEVNIYWTKMQFMNVNDNLFTGVDFSHNRNYLSFFNASNNLIKGNLQALNVPPSLSMLDLASNLITGDVFVPFPNQLETLVLSKNCFSGTIKSVICNCNRLQVLMLDSLNSPNTFHCHRSVYDTMIKAVKGSIPTCLFSMENITSLSIIGNGFSGSLVDLSPNSKLNFVGLMSNRIQGTIPVSWQKFGRFEQLFLSFNKISGKLIGDFAVPENVLFLNMSSNRLSGAVPHTFRALKSLDVIEGNIFSCNTEKNYKNDVFAKYYSCGSYPLTVVGYFSATSCVVCLLIIIYWMHSNLQKKCVRIFQSIEIVYNRTIATIDAKIVCGLTAMTILQLILILTLSATSDVEMYDENYGWKTTTSYLHGNEPIALIFIVSVCIFIITFLIIRFPYRIEPNYQENSELEQKANKYANSLIYHIIILHLINLIVITSLTVIYVYVVLDQTPSWFQQVFSLFLAVTKVFWGIVFISRGFRRYLIDIPSMQQNMPLEVLKRMLPVVLYNEIIAEAICYVACPLVVILLTDSSCFKYLIINLPKVTIIYPSSDVVFETRTITSFYNDTLTVATVTTSEKVKRNAFEVLNPIWLYSNKCTSGIISSYIAVVFYSYLLYSIVLPIAKFQITMYLQEIELKQFDKQMQSKITESVLEFADRLDKSDEANNRNDNNTNDTNDIRNTSDSMEIANNNATINENKSTKTDSSFSSFKSFHSERSDSELIHSISKSAKRLISSGVAIISPSLKAKLREFLDIKCVILFEQTLQESIYQIDLASIAVTSMLHRRRIRHLIMFLFFGLAAPLLGLLVLLTTITEDMTLDVQLDLFADYMQSRYDLERNRAVTLVNRLILTDIPNVYYRYLPNTLIIPAIYWSLYALDVIGDLNGIDNGFIAFVVVGVVNLTIIRSISSYMTIRERQLQRQRQAGLGLGLGLGSGGDQEGVEMAQVNPMAQTHNPEA